MYRHLDNQSYSTLFSVLLGFVLCSGSTVALGVGQDCNCCPPPVRYQPHTHAPQPPSPSAMPGTMPPTMPFVPTEPMASAVGDPPFESAVGDSQFQSGNGFVGDMDLPDLDIAGGLATSFGAGGATSLPFSDQGGYLDSPIVRNQIRFRFDASYDNPTPDRAEFFYPKCGCFVPPGPGPGSPGQASTAETGVDYQEFSLYAESLLFSDVVSAFVEIPFRLINPEVNDNTAGLSDINLGLKVALLTDRYRTLTFQLRTYLPSGVGSRGLGTEHVSLEPALLCMRRFRNGTVVQGEVRDWIPIDGTDDFAGNVLRYGVGVSQEWFNDGRLSIHPVFETVAWSVLQGDVLDLEQGGLVSAETTIVNVKLGTRFNLAPRCRGDATKSLYVGYGKALTDDRWYDDTLRAEYRVAF